jgi:hypothetical protein
MFFFWRFWWLEDKKLSYLGFLYTTEKSRSKTHDRISSYAALKKCPEILLWIRPYFCFEKWTMMENKIKLSLCESLQCGSEWSFGRWAIPRNNGVVACVIIGGTQKKKGRWLGLRGCPFGGEDEHIKKDPQLSSQMWTSFTFQNTHVNCMSGSRDNGHEPRWSTCDNTPSPVGTKTKEEYMWLASRLVGGEDEYLKKDPPTTS